MSENSWIELWRDDPSLLAVFVAISFIVTWGLGLTPPLLIRYAFVRHPLSKKAASWIAASFSVFFWAAFFTLNTVLDEEPGTGVVWVLIFIVNRWILSRGYVKKRDLEAV